MFSLRRHLLRLQLVSFFVGIAFPKSPQVHLESTIVTGKLSGNVEFFGGIPYAEPPLGDLRLRPAVVKNKISTAEFDASDFGKACLQPDIPRDTVSEDCLTLNIFRPADTSVDSALPILLWIHGGGFVSGTGSRPGYNGSALVERSTLRGSPLMVITINYRLGPLGFPQGKEFDSHKELLNLGLKDQLVALEWVKRNIEVFGGDPSKVTVFGESAGGRSIELHILNGNLQGLVRGAIMESSGSLPTHPPAVRDSPWMKYIEAIPSYNPTFPSIERIRNATTDELYNAFATAGITASSFDWIPVIDGPGGMIPNYPSQLTIPHGAEIPVIYGNVLDEGTMATPQTVTTAEETLTGLFSVFTPSPHGDKTLNDTLSNLLKLYPDDPNFGSPFNTGDETFGLDKEYKRYAAMFTDLIESAERRLFADKMAEFKFNTPTYTYLFADPDGVSVVPKEFKSPSFTPGSLGVPHTSEILYVFGNFEVENSTMPQTAHDLSMMMMDYWISFAVEVDPNDGRGVSRPRWRQYHSLSDSEVSNDELMILQLKGGETRMIPDTFRREPMDFIDRHSVVFDR
ncbi:alpha/beta-hydrolase, partial [Marasmius fiardii PR-910]